MSSKCFRQNFLILSVVALMSAATASASPMLYRATALGTLGGTFSYGADINNRGQVSGSSNTAAGIQHGFVYENGRMVDIGAPAGKESSAGAINESGQVGGTWWRPGDVRVGEVRIGEGFLYSNGRSSALPWLGGRSTVCCGLNDLGEAVGASFLDDNVFYHAFVVRQGVITDLGTLGGFSSSASDINNRRQITGYSYTPGLDPEKPEQTHAFLCTAGKMQDLGTLGGEFSNANRINERGDVVGYSSIAGAGPLHGFLYSSGVMKDVGTLGGTTSDAIGLNRYGHVTGSSDLAGDAIAHAFLYQYGVMYDLNPLVLSGIRSGVFLSAATAINDNGWIVANGSDQKAYLLRLDTVAVPEPSSLVLAGAGLVVLLLLAKRRTSGHIRRASLPAVLLLAISPIGPHRLHIVLKLTHCVLLIVGALAAQPMITSGAVLNAASYKGSDDPSSGIAQGSMFVLFGTGLGPETLVQASAFPLPATLAGSSVTIRSGAGTVPAVMVYTSARQIVAILPSQTPVGTALLTVSYNGLVSVPVTFRVVKSSFGVFSLDATGHGAAVVQTVGPGTDVTLNSLFALAHPRQVGILWGTGLGAIGGSDASQPPVGNLDVRLTVAVGQQNARILYQGRSGCCAGVDQIIFEIPDGVHGCALPIAVSTVENQSNITTIAVAEPGRFCLVEEDVDSPDILTAINAKTALLQGIDALEADRQLAAFLRARPEFSDVRLTETGLSATFKDGPDLVLFKDQLPRLSAAQTHLLQTKSPVSTGIDPANPIGLLKTPRDRGISPRAVDDDSLGELPASEHFMVLNAMNPDIRKLYPLLNFTEDIRGWLHDQGYKDDGGAATVSNLRSIKNSRPGVFLIATHGLVQEIFVPATPTAPQRIAKTFSMWTADSCQYDAKTGKYAPTCVGTDGFGHLTGEFIDDVVQHRIILGKAYDLLCPPDEKMCVDGFMATMHWSITPAFIEYYWKFSQDSMVYMMVCNSFDADVNGDGMTQLNGLQAALKAANASLVGGWTRFPQWELGADTTRLVFDRLLGNNKFSKEKEQRYDQRAFPDAATFIDVGLHGLGGFGKDQSGTLALRVLQPNFAILAPSIHHIEVTFDSHLILEGTFGTDPGSAGSITVGGLDVKDSCGWEARRIDCRIPETGKGSSGEVIVEVRHHKSNVAVLSQWEGTIKFVGKGGGTQKIDASFPVVFRGDIRQSRAEIHEGPELWPFGILQAQRTMGDVTCSGTEVSGSTTTTWDGSGRFPLLKASEGGPVLEPFMAINGAVVGPEPGQNSWLDLLGGTSNDASSPCTYTIVVDPRAPPVIRPMQLDLFYPSVGGIPLLADGFHLQIDENGVISGGGSAQDYSRTGYPPTTWIKRAEVTWGTMKPQPAPDPKSAR